MKKLFLLLLYVPMISLRQYSINTDDLDNESWERYNFHDMPVVGALTFLSKWQLDIKSIESDVTSHILD